MEKRFSLIKVQDLELLIEIALLKRVNNFWRLEDIDEEEADADDNQERGGDQLEVSNTTIANESQNMEVNNEAAEEIVEETLDTQDADIRIVEMKARTWRKGTLTLHK